MIARNPITILKGHFDGKRIILDEPPPADLQANTPVEVRYEKAAAGAEQPPQRDNGAGVDEVKKEGREETVLDKIAKLAKPRGMPPDFAAQHDHYIYGHP